MKLTPDLQFETELELISQDSRHRILRRIRRRRENSRPMNSEISYRSRWVPRTNFSKNLSVIFFEKLWHFKIKLSISQNISV